MLSQTSSPQRQEWTPCNPSVPQKQEAGYSPGTDSLFCSSVLVSPPTPHIASLILATEPSVICFLFPRSQLQLRSLSHILNSACSKMSDLRHLFVLLPAPNPPSQHMTLVFRMLTLPEASEMLPIRTWVLCFPSQRYPQTLTGTHPLILKNKAIHIMVMGKCPSPHSHVCPDTVHVTTPTSI